MQRTISFKTGPGSYRHNNRTFTAENVDPERRLTILHTWSKHVSIHKTYATSTIIMKGRHTMNSTFTNSRTGIRYGRLRDYYLPCLKLPESDDRPIGIWGQRRRQYLKEHHRILYYNLLTRVKLHDHLADVNEEAAKMFTCLVQQLSEKESVPEQLKAENQMLWVTKMNNIRNRAEEIVMEEFIYREDLVK